MKKLVLISLSLLLISCQNNNKKIILNKTQTKYELIGYTPDSFEVYRLNFSDEYGSEKGFTYYVKTNTKNISAERNNK
jgi:hypothetical protein